MRYLYSILFYLALPFVLIRLFWRSRQIPEYRRRILERFGYCPYRLTNTIWVHSVSVGETIASIPLIKALKKDYPGHPILVTNMTPTGAARVKAAFADTVLQAYIPYDLPSAVKRFLDRIQPKISIILETELWPNLLFSCQQRQIPIVIANARLSEKSMRGYQCIASLTRGMLDKVTMLASQGKADAERFISLGMNAKKVTVTGNLKFDLEIPQDLAAKGDSLRKQLGVQRPIWIAASTHAGEEEIILNAHRLLLKSIPEALLILVPRHPDRFDQVAALISQQGFQLARRSQAQTCRSETTVYLGDTMGELLLLYSAADVAFVAGSFAQIGGHNLLEPAALNKAVVSGPQLFNFTEISQYLLANKALTIVNNGEELAAAIQTLLTDFRYRKQMGDNARHVVDENRGALKKQLDLIQQLI